jgi:uncharacterized protein YqgC (DUF456 family)
MNGILRRLLKGLQYGIGITLIVVGVIGLFVPVLQGVLMIALGVFILRAKSIPHIFQTIRKKWRKWRRK